MNYTEKILRGIPFFRHFSDQEIAYLLKAGRLSSFKKSQTIDLKKSNTFNLIINGIFEIEAQGKKDIVYLSPGSFFGTIPFSDHRHRGVIRAVIDSTLLIFDEEDLYRFFINSWKGLRGYINSLGKLGFSISETGKKYFGEKSRVISVYSNSSRSGKSLLASLLSLALSKREKTISLDLAYTGNSIFNFFEKKIMSPLSQKQVDNPGIEELINSRIVSVNTSLHLMNVSFGSKVKVNSSILSPVLFILSKEYKYIIIDVSDFDGELREKAFELSDIIFAIIGTGKKIDSLHDLFAGKLLDAQRVYYVVNEFLSGKVKSFEGGLVFDRLEYNLENDRSSKLIELSGSDFMERFVNPVVEKKRALVLESGLLESVYFAGFLNACDKLKIKFNVMYSSAYGYLIIVLYLLSKDLADFNRRVADFFSENRINNILEITFPDEFVFKKGNIQKFAQEICRDNRLENFTYLPVAKLTESSSGIARLFSAGKLSDIFSSSFLIHPAFQSVKISDGDYGSGYPVNTVKAEDLFRTDVDEIYSVSIISKENISFKSENVLRFYRNYIDNLSLDRLSGKQSDLADKNIIIEALEKKLKVEKIIELSEKSSMKSLKI